MPKMIDSRFKSGPNDALAIEDVYEVTESKARNRSVKAIAEISKLLGQVVEPFEPLEDIEIEIPEPPEIPEIVEDILDLIESVMGALGSGSAASAGVVSLTPELLSGLVFGDYKVIWEYGAQQIELGLSGTSDSKENEGVAQSAQEIIDQLTNQKDDQVLKENPPEFLPPITPKKKTPLDVKHPLAQAVVYGSVGEGLGELNATEALGDLLDLIDDENVKTYVGLKASVGALNPKKSNEFLKSPIPESEGDLSKPIGEQGNVAGVQGSTAAVGERSQYQSMTPATDRSNPEDNRLTNQDIDSQRNVQYRPSTGGTAASVVGGVGQQRQPTEQNKIPPTVNRMKPKPLLPEKEASTTGGRPTMKPNDLTGMREDLKGYHTHYPELSLSDNEINLDALELVLDSVGYEYIKKHFPRLVEIILQGFRLKHVKPDVDPLERLERILVKIDSEWAYVKRGEETITKSWLWRFASDDAIKLFTTHPNSNFVTEAIFGQHYREIMPYESIKEQYPNIAL